VNVAKQLLGPAQHLTYLRLSGSGNTPLGLLSVLPVLKQLALGGFVEMVGASSWLQQQPQLTSLVVREYGEEMMPHLGMFPAQLQRLCVDVADVYDSSDDEDVPEVPGGLPESMTQLTRLHTLHVRTDRSQLPPWLGKLTALQELVVRSTAVRHNWEVVGQLPLLRHLCTNAWMPLGPVLRQSPHLCWMRRGATVVLSGHGTSAKAEAVLPNSIPVCDSCGM
jgi:hypothetical protein